eukprot:CAMPEP_0180527576 /NCGR_PEP_ID=MMETSP1036_2-20121128/60311_1 /TAXON_ID=632150 /ORGANISM="Azadinium spinosum, Strain 3D9" /LENGTH=36 /DNA_ID= /DNA_START= /DNA_END= /DNA_ORIENTATION=
MGRLGLCAWGDCQKAFAKTSRANLQHCAGVGSMGLA